MSFRYLKNYLSRSQVREYLQYTLENGVGDIKESHDQIGSDSPLGIRFGSAINSIKQFHVERYIDYYVTETAYVLSSDDSKPELPSDANMVGILYMSKAKDYVGNPDRLGDQAHDGDIGDTIWFSAEEWDDLVIGKTSEGTNHRFFMFWKVVDVLRT